MLAGCGPTQGMRAFLMKSMGYDARVFSVSEQSWKSTSRLPFVNTTFSSTVPKRMAS